MRYHFVILPALAGVAFGNGDSPAGTASVVNNPAATPDALPIEDLRTVPIPTYSIANGVFDQAIPYASADAASLVAAEIAGTPLSVFPAATDVPMNVVSNENVHQARGSEGDYETNVARDSGSKLKRNPSGEARGLHKRAACDPQHETLPNTYNIDLSTPNSFLNDPNLDSVSKNADAYPSGYYQTFENLHGSSSAMNYLGFTTVTTGYDVGYCARRCDAQSGCLAFNIFFERDPTLEPGANCPNPPAYANIKCSFWGSALDTSTATNTGFTNFNFQVVIAGSNGFVSYKLGGPISGWLGPQVLEGAVMNAPLYDCNNVFTYLGYKMLQAGSVDPTLCAAACDAQTQYNLAHPPANGPAVTCSAFGSYILTKTNSTGLWQLGQMCTLYTVYWDEKFAVNTASFDDHIGAKYTYSFSTFYGKQGASDNCAASVYSNNGTVLIGGEAPKSQ